MLCGVSLSDLVQGAEICKLLNRVCRSDCVWRRRYQNVYPREFRRLEAKSGLTRTSFAEFAGQPWLALFRAKYAVAKAAATTRFQN